MNNIGWIFGTVCLIVAVIIIAVNYFKTKKTMNRLDQMIESAMTGTFEETDFNESMLSALETRFAHFLSASLLSKNDIIAEKKQIKELIGDISHQTKTPIANLLLYIELLKEEKLSEQAQEYVENIYIQSDKLHFLIDALIKMSRLENGIISLYPKMDQISFVINQVEQQYMQKAKEKGLQLKVTFQDAEAYFDRKWTIEALCNLLENAIKYTENGEINISVVLYEMFMRIDISDTGIGIKEEEQAKIFSRFYRLNTNAEKEGVGVGLYLTREILRKQGGYIKVTSKEKQGSVFSVFIPRQENSSKTVRIE